MEGSVFFLSFIHSCLHLHHLLITCECTVIYCTYLQGPLTLWRGGCVQCLEAAQWWACPRHETHGCHHYYGEYVFFFCYELLTALNLQDSSWLLYCVILTWCDSTYEIIDFNISKASTKIMTVQNFSLVQNHSSLTSLFYFLSQDIKASHVRTALSFQSRL